MNILAQHGLIKKMAKRQGNTAQNTSNTQKQKKLAKIRHTAEALKSNTKRSRTSLNYSSYLA